MSADTATSDRVLDEKHRAELHASGIRDETIEAAGIYSAADGQLADILHWQPKNMNWGRGFVIPFRFPSDNGQDAYCRVKLDFPRHDERTGKTIKYEAPVKLANRAYFPPRLFDAIADETAPVIITEGEKKSLSAMQHDIPCIGLTGVWSWQVKRKRTDTGRGYGKRELIPDLDAVNWRGRTVYVIFDSDAATNHLVAQAETKLAEALKEKGAIVKVVRLPTGFGGAKAGLDDYLLSQGPDALRTLLKGATPAEAPPAAKAMDLARRFLDDQCMALRSRTLQWWRDAFHVWRDNRYQPIEDTELEAIVLRWLSAQMPDAASPRRSAEVVACLRAECRIPFHLDLPLSLDGALAGRDLIVMENGILDVGALLAGKEKVLLPHSPRWFSMNAVNYQFDPTAACDRFLDFLEQVLEGDPDRIALLQEWTGYNLVPDVSFHKFQILVGEGANGKSVYLDVLEATIGPENVSHVSLELFGGRFQLSPTIGKLANITAEVGDLDKQSEGIFKAFVSGDPVPIDRKHLAPIHVRPTARVTIATNTKPRWADRSEGIWRRQSIIPFSVRIPVEEQDRHLAQSIIETELPGVFNWAIAGLHRLRAQGRFTEPTICVEATADFRQEVNPARAFLLEQCEAAPGNEVPSARLYRAYAEWCDARGYKAMHEQHFGIEIKRVYGVQRFRRRDAGSRAYWYAGIRLLAAQEVAS